MSMFQARILSLSLLIISIILATSLHAQDDKKLTKIKAHIKQQNMKWTAGETSISRMSDKEKRKLFGGKIPDNLNGFEYYKGGIFEIEPEKRPANTGSDSLLIDQFDWRNRHGTNWITSIKNQGACGSCWAFSAVGATEAIINLYFNQHLDLDLSEQDLISCSDAGDCEGGNPFKAFIYMQETGIYEEECFKYAALTLPCEERCPEPVELIKVSDFTFIEHTNGEEYIKRMLIEHGPLNFGIYSWWHFIVLVGYETDEIGTIWILKNSWGTDWGEDGYFRMRVPLDDMYGLCFIQLPVTSKIPTEIDCIDSDGDGYYIWGLSDNPPVLPDDAFLEQDCDDSDNTLGAMDQNGYCMDILPPEPEPIPEPIPEPEPEPEPEPIPEPEPEPIPEPEPEPEPIPEPEITVDKEKHDDGSSGGCFIQTLISY